MTINLNSAVSRVRPARGHAAVVPAAAVWEPKGNHSYPGGADSYGSVTPADARIRTLGLEQRFLSPVANVTPRRVPDSGGSASVARPAQNSGKLGTYVLGAIFGSVLFVGTLLGSALSPDEHPYDHAPADTFGVAASYSQH